MVTKNDFSTLEPFQLQLPTFNKLCQEASIITQSSEPPADEDIERIRQTFNYLMEKYPYYPMIWSNILQFELDLLKISQRESSPEMEGLLTKSLQYCNDISIWSKYLQYIKLKNNIVIGGEVARNIVIDGYQVILSQCVLCDVGFDNLCDQFIEDFLDFLLNQWKPINKYESSMRILKVRKVYKKILSVPHRGIEKLWSQYIGWEQEVDSLNCRKHISDLSPEYMKCRAGFMEWENKVFKKYFHYGNVTNRQENTRFPILSNKTNKSSNIQFWFDWIHWERNNSSENKDTTITHKRISYIYKQALKYTNLDSEEVWFAFADFVNATTNNSYNEAEILSNNDNGNTIPDNNIATTNTNTTPTAITINNNNNINESSSSNMSANNVSAGKPISLLEYAVIAVPTSRILRVKLSEFYELSKVGTEDHIKSVFEDGIQSLQHMINIVSNNGEGTLIQYKKHLTTLFCSYMYTMNRIEGLSGARKVFSKCRKLKQQLNYFIYLENAKIEYNAGVSNANTGTAFKVLELGLKIFSGDGNYIIEYLKFLIDHNQPSSDIKTIFENHCDKILDMKLREQLYLLMMNYEWKIGGDLNKVLKLSERYKECFIDVDSSATKETELFEMFKESRLMDMDLRGLMRASDGKNAITDEIFDNKANLEINNHVEKNGTSVSNKSYNEGENYNPLKDIKNGNALITDSNASIPSHQVIELPPEIAELLQMLPKSKYFPKIVLDPKKLVDYLNAKIDLSQQKH
ncbi:uncharacterized protein SCODWIG_02402 [Saccharomycodes ludwigii]|uniref:mRNA 3'-end-processing protein RNA14 n=1 Tax=Saccharomycodes ludwigii TaxID=36035 RepID=A0A376B7N5_9ASCO|nr:uncharacterized protein SCODWIG_02402 [Saccharomycodes ludwigii]